VPTVEAEPGHHRVRAVGEITPPAGETGPVLPAVPADPDALALPPGGDTGADQVDDAGDLVPGHARIRDARPQTILGERIAVADAPGRAAEAEVSGGWLGVLALDQLEFGAGLGNSQPLHRRHEVSPHPSRSEGGISDTPQPAAPWLSPSYRRSRDRATRRLAR